MSMIFRSLFVIAAVAAIAGGATFAYYSDSDKITGNTFSAGGMDLKIDKHVDRNEFIWSNTFYSGEKISGLYPGYPFNSEKNWQIIDIRNVGVVDGMVTFDINRTTDFNELSSNLKFSVYYNEHNADSGLPHDSDGWSRKIYKKSISELISSDPITLGRLTADGTDINDAKNIASVKIEWFVNPEAGNEIQGKSATLDVVFGLEQVR